MQISSTSEDPDLFRAARYLLWKEVQLREAPLTPCSRARRGYRSAAVCYLRLRCSPSPRSAKAKFGLGLTGELRLLPVTGLGVLGALSPRPQLLALSCAVTLSKVPAGTCQAPAHRPPLTLAAGERGRQQSPRSRPADERSSSAPARPKRTRPNSAGPRQLARYRGPGACVRPAPAALPPPRLGGLRCGAHGPGSPARAGLARSPGGGVGTCGRVGSVLGEDGARVGTLACCQSRAGQFPGSATAWLLNRPKL